MGKFRTFNELDGEEKLAVFEAALFLLIARILVSLLPLKYWRERFGKVSQAKPAPDPALQHISGVVRRAVGRAMRNAPLDFICLPQALAARWMLSRRGIESDLSIGARHVNAEGPRVHAWLTSGGHWVTGDCNPDDFSPFAAE